MPDEQIAILRWQQELDQLTEGMKQRDPETEKRCRLMLAMIARHSTSDTLADVIQALADQWERRTVGAKEL